MSKQKTTEDLREMLIDAMERVRDGNMEPNEAKAMALLADKVIGTAEIELKYSEIISKLDEANTGISPGPLLLTQNKKDA